MTGLLDQMQGFSKKDEAQLRVKLRRCQLPVEKSASVSKLLSGLRRSGPGGLANDGRIWVDGWAWLGYVGVGFLEGLV